jgi:hypothetical protein
LLERNDVLPAAFAHNVNTHPPLTGGKKAISSPAPNRVSQAANS